MKIIDGAIAIDSVTIFVPDSHPSYPHWVTFGKEHYMDIVTDTDALKSASGEYLFLVSCSEIVRDDIKKNFKHCVVIHESDLPKGRGWSPLAWQILEGKNRITVSAILCAKNVDCGDIVSQSFIELDGSELCDEIHEKSFRVKSGLIRAIVRESMDKMRFAKQEGYPSYYPRRTPADSELDPGKTIAEQFDLLRICEPRFPAFFRHRGIKYKITIEKMNDVRG